MLSEDTIRERMVRLTRERLLLEEKIEQIAPFVHGDSSVDDQDQITLLREMLAENRTIWRALNWVVNPVSENI